MFHTGDPADAIYLILRGTCQVFGPATPEQPLGVPLRRLTAGQLLSERSFLSEVPHVGRALCCAAESCDPRNAPVAGITAGDQDHRLVVAEFRRQDVDVLLRRRPDIGMIMYKNLAQDLGRKLHEQNVSNTSQPRRADVD